MRIEDAIAHTAGAPCLMVLSFPKECVTPLQYDRKDLAVQSSDKTADRSPMALDFAKSAADRSPMALDFAKDAEPVATWLVKGGHLVTLTRGEHDTFIYFHSKDLLFYAHPHLALPPSLPRHTALLAQVYEDSVDDPGAPGGKRRVPRFSVFDVALPAMSDPARRGEFLRQFQLQLPAQCYAQWSGDLGCLRSFLGKGMPHECEALVLLGANPLRPTWEAQ